ncbi:MAG: chitinase [Dehalococcoidia bacterium]
MNGILGKISLKRLALVAGAAAGVVAFGAWWIGDSVDVLKNDESTTWVAPYVDTTLTPIYHFEDGSVQESKDVVLGFIVADAQDACKPSWGSYYDLEAAARALDLDRRIVRLQERGGQAVVSFGGAVNHELATVCKDSSMLVAAYQSVIDRYDAWVLDFDVEGAALGDTASNIRRAEAIRKLQQSNSDLKVWFTLPVAVEGLTAEGINFVDTLLAAGVDIGGINVMTMNYGGSRTAGMDMREATAASLKATHKQLADAYKGAGLTRTDRQLWNALGATPMIGRNDIPADVFTVADAKWLTQFALDNRLGRLSYWSANRDSACGPGVEDRGVSNTCSSVAQNPAEFAQVFLAVAGRPSTDALPPASPVEPGDNGRIVQPAYDPATAPYALWRGARRYVAGDKVVWQGRVYEAKWWTENNQPDEPVANAWDTPWRYLGPVLESDRQAVQSAAPEGTRPKWNSETVYVAGNEVVYGNDVFKAKWWTQGNLPQQDPDRPYDHPWQYLGVLVAPQAVEQMQVQPKEGRQPWDVAGAYEAGTEVTHKGQAFRAKWWTQGDLPQSNPINPYEQPWQFIGTVGN